MRYWLFKSEADHYSLDDLARDGRTGWDGVRNYQARNFLRDDCRVGDLVLFYHSNGQPPTLVGLAEVSAPAHPDPTQFDPTAAGYDPTSPPDNPRWLQVEISFVERFTRPLGLPELRADPALEGLELLRKGSRLSVQPVSEAHFQHLVRRARG